MTLQFQVFQASGKKIKVYLDFLKVQRMSRYKLQVRSDGTQQSDKY